MTTALSLKHLLLDFGGPVLLTPYGLDLRGLMRHFYDPPGDYLVRPEMASVHCSWHTR